jgi:hypothetical protein
MEHINLEKSEINNVKTRLTQQTLENNAISTVSDAESAVREMPATESALQQQEQQEQQEGSVSRQSIAPQRIVGKNVTSSAAAAAEEKPVETHADDVDNKETSWLNQVIPNNS